MTRLQRLTLFMSLFASLAFGAAVWFGSSGRAHAGEVALAVGGGVLYGALIASFAGWRMSQMPELELLEHERLIKSDAAGRANYWLGIWVWETQGWLYLTDRRFCFRGDPWFFQPDEHTQPAAKIRAVELGTAGPLFDTAIRLDTASERETFAVDQADEWRVGVQGLIGEPAEESFRLVAPSKALRETGNPYQTPQGLE